MSLANNLIRCGTERFIGAYINSLEREGLTPHTSQDVLTKLQEHGLAYAFGAYVHHCLDRGENQAELITTVKNKRTAALLCGALFALTGPFEAAASIIVGAQKVRKIEENTPLVDWTGNNSEEERSGQNSNNGQGRVMGNEEWQRHKKDVQQHNATVFNKRQIRRELEERMRLPDPRRDPHGYLKARELRLEHYRRFLDAAGGGHDVDPESIMADIQDLLAKKGKNVTYEDIEKNCLLNATYR